MSGSIAADCPVTDAIATYLSHGSSNQAVYVAPPSTKLSGPHVKRVEIVCSAPNGMHEFGKSMEVRFRISHAEPMSKGCFSFQIVNQFQDAVVHAWAHYPDFHLGPEAGETNLICKFPSLRLNVGHYHIRTHLAEPPGMEFYQRLDGVCPFEVVRTEDTRLWGWYPESCVYHEEWSWRVEPDAYPVAGGCGVLQYAD